MGGFLTADILMVSAAQQDLCHFIQLLWGKMPEQYAGIAVTKLVAKKNNSLKKVSGVYKSM